MLGSTGPSGAGESTWLHVVGAALPPSSGRYLFKGKPVQGNASPLAKFRREHIGFILQHFALIKNRAVLYSISLSLQYQKVSRQDIRERVLQVSKALGVADRLAMYPLCCPGAKTSVWRLPARLLRTPGRFGGRTRRLFGRR